MAKTSPQNAPEQTSIVVVGPLMVASFAAVVAIFGLRLNWQATALLLILSAALTVTFLCLLSAAGRNRLADILDRPRFAQIYDALSLPIFRWLWRRLGGSAGGRSGGVWAGLSAALNWRVFDRAMLIAVLYPIALFFWPWLWAGHSVALAGEAILPRMPRFGVAHLWVLITLFLVAIAMLWSQSSKYRGARGVTRPDILLWGSVLFLVFGAWLEVIPPNAVAAAGAAAFAAAFAVAVARLVSARRTRAATALLLITWTAGCLATAALIPWQDVSPPIRALFMFLGLFPMLNALFDTVSYAVTLALLRSGLKSRAIPALGFAALDIGVAIVLYAYLGAAVVASVAGLNALAGVELLPLGDLLIDLRDGQVAPENRWVVFMIFSTLLPTAAHLLIALLSVQAVVPHKLRGHVAHWVRQARGDHVFHIAGAIVAVPFVLL